MFCKGQHVKPTTESYKNFLVHEGDCDLLDRITWCGITTKEWMAKTGKFAKQFIHFYAQYRTCPDCAVVKSAFMTKFRVGMSDDEYQKLLEEFKF